MTWQMWVFLVCSLLALLSIGGSLANIAKSLQRMELNQKSTHRELIAAVFRENAKRREEKRH